MIRTLTAFALTILLGLYTPAPLFAQPIGGFDFEKDTFGDVQDRLSRSGIGTLADGRPDGSLRLTLDSHPLFGVWGHLQSIVLTFTPAGQLYQLEAVYGDTGNAMMKLSQAFQTAGFTTDTFDPGTIWQRGPVTVHLQRDPDPLAALTYLVITNEQRTR